jgi:hypothetical protein
VNGWQVLGWVLVASPLALFGWAFAAIARELGVRSAVTVFGVAFATLALLVGGAILVQYG